VVTLRKEALLFIHQVRYLIGVEACTQEEEAGKEEMKGYKVVAVKDPYHWQRYTRGHAYIEQYHVFSEVNS